MHLSIRNLSKQYPGGVWGLRDFSLEIPSGVLGLLGPNGAGKSTLMRILATITKPTNGAVTWNDIDILSSPKPLRQALGYLPQDFGVYPNLTAREFLEYIAAAKGIPQGQAREQIARLLTDVNLAEAGNRQLSGYSGGMRQRVGIAQSLLGDPKVLIVDEPTVGLDPEERVRFRNLLSELSGDRIVILSTHVVSDVEAIAENIAIINHGQLLRFASPEKLLSELEGRVWQITVPADQVNSLKNEFLITGTTRRAEGVQVRIVSDASPRSDARTVSATLEEVYLSLIQEPKRRSTASAA